MMRGGHGGSAISVIDDACWIGRQVPASISMVGPAFDFRLLRMRCVAIVRTM
jgi:hypothetical protein